MALRDDGVLDVVDAELEVDEDAESVADADAARDGLLRLMTGATTETAGVEEAGVGEVLIEPVKGPLE